MLTEWLFWSMCAHTRQSKIRSGSYRGQLCWDMCDSHLGQEGGLHVNISYRQHSTPLLLYSTLSAECVLFSVPVCSSPHLHSFSLCLTVESPPRLATGPECSIFSLPYLEIQIQSSSYFCTDVDAMKCSTPLAHLYHPSLPYLAVFKHSMSCFSQYLCKYLCEVWCNVIFCLSPSLSGAVCLCCYWSSLGLPWHVGYICPGGWRGWRGLGSCPTSSPSPPPILPVVLFIHFVPLCYHSLFAPPQPMILLVVAL